MAKLADLTDNVLFGVCGLARNCPGDRSLVTVSALIAMNRPDQLRSHLAGAPERLTQEGVDRSHHPPGVLRGLANRHRRGRHQGSFEKK